MLVHDEALFNLEDQAFEVINSLLSTQEVNEYLQASQLLEVDSEAQHLKAHFLEMKSKFELIEPYGKHAPDYKKYQREVRRAKRELDMHPSIADFKYAETKVQENLDYLCLDIANVISDNIKVDAGNPFFEFAKKGCGGSCHGKS